jgi:hypothetical protein
MKESKIVEYYGRIHVDLFQQGKLLPPGINMTVKFVPSDYKFALISDEDNAAYKFQIMQANLIIQTKQLSDALHLAHRQLILTQNMRIPYTRIMLKHVSIGTGLSTIAFDNLFAGALPDLVVIGLVEDDNYSGTFKTNPFAFKENGVNRIELMRNGTKVPRFGYTPNFADKQYIKDYRTFLNELNFDDGDRALNISPSEWANGYTLYAFKLTEGPIGNGVDVPRSTSTTGSARLEITFKAALAKNLKCVIMYQMLGILEIDRYNNIYIS